MHPDTNYLVVLEKDHQSKTIVEADAEKQQNFAETKDEQFFNTPWHELGGYLKSVKDSFASCVRIVDPTTMETQSVLHFGERETCFSIYVSQAPMGQAY